MQISNNSARKNHFITVIIPTLGRKSLIDTLAALDEQTRRADEVLVILDKERKGVGWARNQGIIKSNGDLVVFTDDDCIPSKDWLQTLVQTLDKYNADGVGGSKDETDSILRDGRLRRKFPLATLVDEYGWVGNTANVMYKKEWLDILQHRDNYVFNENMINSSDFECAWRLRRYGARLVYVNKNVIHMKKVRIWGYFRYQFAQGMGIAYLFLAYRKAGAPTITHQESLIWGQTGTKKGARWMKATFRYILGPFDPSNFTNSKNFIVFWVGEKFKAVGFIYCLVKTGQ